jgi:hypothetical protein
MKNVILDACMDNPYRAYFLNYLPGSFTHLTRGRSMVDFPFRHRAAQPQVAQPANRLP